MSPTISIITSVYNIEKYLPACIDSILAQTFTNFELILIDDGSTDQSGNICDLYAQKDSRCKVIHQKNKGYTIARNSGLEIATGEYIGFVDGDDLLLPDCITNNINYITTKPQTNILFSKVEYLFENEEIKRNYKSYFLYGAFYLTKHQFKHLLLTTNFIPAATCFIRKKIWTELNGYDENIPFMEDWVFWIKATQKNIKFDFLNKKTIKYRIHNSSLSTSMKPNKKFMDSVKLAQQYSLKIQKKYDILLWIINKLEHETFTNKKTYLEPLRYTIKRINPASFYIKYIENKIRKINIELNLNN